MIRGIRRLGIVGEAITMSLLCYLQKWTLTVTHPLLCSLGTEQKGEIIGKYFMKCDSRWAIKYDSLCGVLAKILLMTLWLDGHFGKGYKLDRPSRLGKGEPYPSKHHAVLRLVMPKMCYLSQGNWIMRIIKIRIRVECCGLCGCWIISAQPLHQPFNSSNTRTHAKGGIKWGHLTHTLSRGKRRIVYGSKVTNAVKMLEPSTDQ